jgi:alkylation response protein AidB-like acyl-CoA dehydrogenase
VPELLFELPELPASAQRLRRSIRKFLQTELASYSPLARSASWDGYDAAFSRKLGAAGFIGVALPRRYGGRGAGMLDRYVVLEECLAAGAPTGLHWFADRQSGPLLLKYGTEAQRLAILPGICRGELCFCIGMSEPDAGSDLAALRTQGRRVENGWILNGSKLWTTNAHRADYMIALVRTAPATAVRHDGYSQFLIDLKRSPGIQIRPVRDLTGREHFNEVTFTDCLVPADALIGEEGRGWGQVTAELALERSGPERFLSCHVLFEQLLVVLAKSRDSRVRDLLGRLVARLSTLRAMSLSVAGMLDAGEDPGLQASIVKDLGAEFEQALPGICQELVDLQPSAAPGASDYQQVLASLMMLSPSFSLRGGTVEILRGIVARNLGLR